MMHPYAINEAWMQASSDPQQPWLKFTSPVRTEVIDDPTDLARGLEFLDSANSEGFWLVGYLTYEAAPGVDPALITHSPKQPVLSFSAFNEPSPSHLPRPSKLIAPIEFEGAQTEAEHALCIEKIQDRIAAGDCYQVNHTFALSGQASSDSFELFQAMHYRSKSSYSCLLISEAIDIVSASPELLFEKQGNTVTTQPMKGTRPRGTTAQEDTRLLNELRTSEKDLAENIMICDMSRNDLSLIARTGTLVTNEVANVTSYPTVHQMTSTVSVETDNKVSEIFRAIFPAASITGAPKFSATQIINSLETGPRGIYTGSIGWIAPNADACFNVAIRTAVVDKATNIVTYGVGGGITTGSVAQEEYAEAMVKANVAAMADLGFFESIHHSEDFGYCLLNEHFERLLDSLKAAGVPVSGTDLLAYMESHKPKGDCIFKLCIYLDGTIRHAIAPRPKMSEVLPTVRLDSVPVDSDDFFLRHKTTQRVRYLEAADPDFYDVILWNVEGFITESTVANVVIKQRGQYFTPDETAGLLPGTLRSKLLKTGLLVEKALSKLDLTNAEEIYLINSVRGWVKVQLADE